MNFILNSSLQLQLKHCLLIVFFYISGKSSVISNEIFQNLTELVTADRKYIPADLFYIGRTMRATASQQNSTTPISSTNSLLNNPTAQPNLTVDTNNIVKVLNNLMYVNQSVAKISQISLNTTNIILDAFDNIINDMSYNFSNNSDDNLNDTICIITPKCIVYIIDPSVKNISGIALYKNLTKVHLNQTVGNFNDFYIKQIESKQNSSELMLSDDLEVAAYLPTKLINQIIYLNSNLSLHNVTIERPPMKIVISLFYDDVMFQDNKNTSTVRSDSIIISVSIPGYSSILPSEIPIFFKPKTIENTTQLCGFWDFEPNDRRSTGDWSENGCEFIGFSENGLAQCGCTHLTHFSFLLTGSFDHKLPTTAEELIQHLMHEKTLDLITIIGCSLSLLGIFGILLTAFMFESWREKSGSKVLLQLSCAIGFQMILMLLTNLKFADNETLCLIFGAFLHYSVLSVFAWMLITAYLQFLRFVKVLGNLTPKRFFLKSFIIGWCIPFVIVLLCVLIAPYTYTSSSGVCYPSQMTLYIGVILPVILIIIANLIIFVLVIVSVSKKGVGRIDQKGDWNLQMAQLRLVIFLFFLLGFSWIFGLINSWKGSVIFSYFFCLTATLQGLVLFIYFILMHPVTRNLWRNFFTRIGCSFCKSNQMFNKSEKNSTH